MKTKVVRDRTACLSRWPTLGGMALLGILVVCCRPAAAGPRNVKPGEPVGNFRLTDVDGKEVDTAKWKGEPSVWLFASAGQKSTEQAVVDLAETLAELHESKVHAAVLTSDEERLSQLRDLWKRRNLPFPLAIDSQRRIYGRIGVIVLPTTLVVDSAGKLHHALSGHSLDYKAELAAHLAFVAGKISAAELEKALERKGENRDLERERADRLCRSAAILLERGLAREAEAELRRALELDPSHAEAYLQLADLLVRKGEIAEAEELVREVERCAPDNRHQKLTLGIIRFHQKRLDDAEALLSEALVLNPDPVRTYYWLGRVSEAQGDPEKAAAQYRAAVEKLRRDL